MTLSIGNGTASGRVRRWAPKTRTGCATCRKRRVKCDEAKPQCRRCEAIGVICGGYSGTAVILHTFSASQQRPFIVKEPGDSPAPVAVTANPRDMRMFDLLRSETVQQLTGPFDRPFWTVDVLQATRQYPAMWHGCLALAAIQKQQMIPAASESARGERGALYVFSLQQYDCAVRSVIQIVRRPAARLTDADKEAVLLAAIIFSSIASLKGDAHEARVHARHCVQLFQCWRSWEAVTGTGKMRRRTRSAGVLKDEVITAIATHFECQFPNTSGAAELTPYRCGTRPFFSAAEAYYEFTQLLCNLNTVARSNGAHHRDASSRHAAVYGPEPDLVCHYRTEFRVWRRRFNRLRVSNFDKPVDREGIRVLELLFIGIEPVLDMDSVEVLRRWNEYFAHVWDLYRRSGAILREEDALYRIEKDHSCDSRRFILSVSPAPSAG